ncbi:ribonuclease H-like domain-containing protein [Mycena galopus ATCC 62051]|nr:ribonuclease H-like domain-containing protein [Mycena galopus ATCC 62051]
MANSTPVNVKTNSFAITRLPTKDFFQYDVFRPELPIPNKRERAIYMLQTTIAPNVFHPRGVFDGTKLLYLSHRLNLPGGGGAASFSVRLGNDPNAPIGAPGVFEVVISKTASEVIRPTYARTTVLESVRLSSAFILPARPELIVSRNHPTNNGRAYFSAVGKKVLPDGIELWRGYFQSVRPTIGRMIVTIDTSMAAVYESGLLHEVAMHVLGVRSTRDLTLADESDSKFRKLQGHLKNRLIKTRTTGDKTKTIHAIVPGPIGRYTFMKDGRNTTIQEHFRAAYNITLQHPVTFGVRVSGRNAPFPVIVPAELCAIIPGQLYKRRLPPSATAAAVDFATQRPSDRMRSITGGTNAGVQSPIQGYSASEYVHDSGMVVDQRPITLQAKLLAHPRMEFHKSDLMPNNGAWNAVGRIFKSSKSLMRWAVVNFDTRVDETLVNDIIRALMKAGRDMAVENPKEVRNGAAQVPRKILDAVGEAMDRNIDMVVVILPSKADEIRTEVKYWGDVLRGVRTSCLREDKVKRANNQLNARLGGHYALPRTNVLTQLPLMGVSKPSPFMILGADVAHPGPGVSRPSIASLVFSWDAAASSYAAISQVQAPRQEIIPELKVMVKKAILAFGMKGPPPRKIIFYRDGVSEGEQEKVKTEEIAAIKDACHEVWREKQVDGPLPLITFICVVKRHHTIFLPNDATVDDGKTGNCRAGLAVDEAIRSPLALDFFLQSHAAIKGTSRSGHYSILLDEIFNNNVSAIQQLSFELCHVYAKATRSISIPAPVYYADMVCARAKFNMDPSQCKDYDASTNTTGSEDFDLEYWKRVYKPASEAAHYDKTMYFL